MSGALGVTATTINVGIVTLQNAGAANDAVGGTGVGSSDRKADFDVLIHDVNAHGGIAGHRVVPVYYSLDATSTESYESEFQAACSFFTEDHHVFAVFSNGTESFLRCLAQHGVVQIWEDLTGSYEDLFRKYPTYIEPGALDLDRAASAEAASLVRQRYFTGWNAVTGGPATGNAVVGVLAYDTVGYRHAATQRLEPALARAGIHVKDSVFVAAPKSFGEVSNESAAISSAVLKFHQDGVNHVIIMDATGLMTLLFLNNAESQGYHPRYGVNSQNGLGALVAAGDVQTDQATGAAGLGWLPAIDLRTADDPDNGPYSNSARRACMSLMTKHGIDVSSINGKGDALEFCDDMWFLREALDAGGNVLTTDGFLAGVAAIGSRFVAGWTLRVSLSATRHDGVAAGRDMKYVAACTCMRYAGPEMSIP